MKKFIKGFWVSALFIVFKTHANITVEDTDSTSFDLAGTILPECKVQARIKNRSTALDLTSATRQKTSNIWIWCNTGQSQATTTYSSLSGGYLVNEAGNQIPYLMQIPGTIGNVSLAQAQTVNQRAGNGTGGSHKGRVINITPQVNGFEYAGVYRDTIEVTVTAN